MKKVSIALILITSLAMTTGKKTKIIFFGDSITEMGIKKGGYIDRMQASIKEKGLQNRYELIGAGIGGNKVYDLYLRMEEDVMVKKPNIVVIYVGINDVWHKTSGIGTDIVKYERFYVALIKKLQAKKASVVLCTPTVIGEKKNNANPQDADLNAYSEVIRKLANTYDCKLVDLRKAFVDYEIANNNNDSESGLLTYDRVHLTDKGNQLVADEMMNVLSIR